MTPDTRDHLKRTMQRCGPESRHVFLSAWTRSHLKDGAAIFTDTEIVANLRTLFAVAAELEAEAL